MSLKESLRKYQHWVEALLGIVGLLIMVAAALLMLRGSKNNDPKQSVQTEEAETRLQEKPDGCAECQADSEQAKPPVGGKENPEPSPPDNGQGHQEETPPSSPPALPAQEAKEVEKQ